MTPAVPRRSPEVIARLGEEIYARKVRVLLKPEDEGKYIAIDIATEDYEIDEDDYTAVMSLHARRLGAEVWLMRIGSPAAYKMGLR